MPIFIIFLYIVIIIFPIVCSFVIWRININAVYFPCITVCQGFQGMIVFCIDNHMVGIVWGASFNAVNFLESWINYVPITNKRHNILHRNRHGFTFSCQISDFIMNGFNDP